MIELSEANEKILEKEKSYDILRDELDSLKNKFEDTKENMLTLSHTLEETNSELEKV